MEKTIDTFSANSLKILNNSIEEFKNKYVYNLSVYKKEQRALLGQKFHALLCAYLADIPIKNMLYDLNDNEKVIWNKLEAVLKDKKKNFCYTEYPFLIKEELKNKYYYLTGRMDAIYKENDSYTIYDWKTLKLPDYPAQDLQSIVYLYCAGKIFNSNKIKIKYLSIEKLESKETDYKDEREYRNLIDSIVNKYYKI